MKILLGDFNAKLGRGYFQTDNLEWNLHLDGNDNDVTVVNFATSKNQVV